MRKAVGIVALAMSLIGSTTVVLAQASPSLTEPTGTEANRRSLQQGGSYYGGSYGYYSGVYRSPRSAWAFVAGPHRRWHSSRRRARW
jgi:hypothetical protein